MQHFLAQFPKTEREAITAMLPMLADPVARLHCLYKITDKHGHEIDFAPTPEQSAIIHAVHRQGQKRHIILKARQMGFSTLIELMLFDAVHWEDNTSAAIVDQTQAAAHLKLKNKIRFAWEKLPLLLRRPPTLSNNSEMAWPNGSSVTAGMHVRGGTLQWLHISEWGPIAAEDPKRSDEIKTGALPAAEKGVIIIETTFKGGKGGHLYDLIKRAQETPAAERTEKDYRFWFFPWYLDRAYTLDGPESAIPKDIHDYCDAKEAELGITLTTGQRLWYAKTSSELGIFMLREYPTTAEEAFAAPIDGAIYGDIISKIRAAGQIRDFLYDPAYPIFSVWDIGYSDSTSVWLFQLIGRDIYWLWHHRDQRITAAQAWHKVTASGIPITGNYLPHDAANSAAATGLSYKTALENAGATHVTVLPQTRDIWAGIDATRSIIQRSTFHKTHCALGLEALEAYHTKTERIGTSTTEAPVHDWSSHDADALRYGAEAITLGLVKTHAARRLAHTLDAPFRAGAVVDLDTLRQHRCESHGRTTALSGLNL